MKINFNNKSNYENMMSPQANQNNKQSSKLYKRLVMIEKKITEIKENEKLSPLEKSNRVKQLEQQKQEITKKIQEAKVKEKMSELDEKVEKVEEKKIKDKDRGYTKATPKEEMEAELGLNDIGLRQFLRASTHYHSASKRLVVSKSLVQEAKIFERQIKTDAHLGQNIDSKDFRVKKMNSNLSQAKEIQEKTATDLIKANRAIKKANKHANINQKDKERIKNDSEKQGEEQENVEKKGEKTESFLIVGQNIDISL